MLLLLDGDSFTEAELATKLEQKSEDVHSQLAKLQINGYVTRTGPLSHADGVKIWYRSTQKGLIEYIEHLAKLEKFVIVAYSCDLAISSGSV